jgi:hypothetical protein
MMDHRESSVLSCVGVAAVLAACGGGGGADAPPGSADAPVAGAGAGAGADAAPDAPARATRAAPTCCSSRATRSSWTDWPAEIVALTPAPEDPIAGFGATAVELEAAAG